MMSPVKFEKKSKAAVDAFKEEDDDAEALFPPPGNNTNDDNKNNNKTKLLSKMRPKALDLSPNGLHKGQVGTASTDELVNLEIREKSWRECKNRASGAYYLLRFNFFFNAQFIHRCLRLFSLTSRFMRNTSFILSFVRVRYIIVLYENFLYVGGDEMVTKEKHLRRLKEELNVKRILCCYDPKNSVSSRDLSSPGNDAARNRDNNNNIINNNNESGDAALTPSSCTSGGASFASTPTTEGEGDFESALAYFERMSLPLMDTSDEDIACVLYDAFDFILGNGRRECVWEKNINKRKDEVEKEEEEDAGGCLVHCQMGCSRSVAICVAFIMWREGVTYDEAFERVKESRSIARPNIGFVKTLEAWHESRTNRATTSLSSSSGIFDVVSYKIVEHKNRKGYVVPKRENFSHATTNQDSTATNNSSNGEKKKENDDDEENGTTTPSPKASSPSFSSSPAGYCLSPKDDPNLVAVRFKNAKGKETLFQPTIVVGDRVDRENDPRVDEQTLDKITKQILFYEYGVTLS